MDATTFLCRTSAGDAELAAARHGLSITQRRILTLLDTPATLDDLGARHPAAREWLQRDVVRLAQSGLVREQEAANDEMTPPDALMTRRPGEPSLSRRIFVVLVVVALAGAGWHYGAPHVPSAPGGTRTVPAHTDSASGTADASAGSEPAAIATRVLRGDVSDRSRDAARANATAAHAPKPVGNGAETDPHGRGDAVSRAAGVTDDVHLPASPAAIAPTTTTTTAPATPSRPPATASATDVSASPPPASSAQPASPILQSAPPILQPVPSAPLPVPETAPTAASVSPVSTAPAHLPSAAAPATTPTTAGAPADTSKSAEASTQLASATPSPAASRGSVAMVLVPVTREAPEFPREAIAEGLEAGMVKARLTIDAQGNVSSVDILDATPRRVFDRAVRSALLRWQFPPGAAGRSTTVDVAFKRD